VPEIIKAIRTGGNVNCILVRAVEGVELTVAENVRETYGLNSSSCVRNRKVEDARVWRPATGCQRLVAIRIVVTVKTALMHN